MTINKEMEYLNKIFKSRRTFELAFIPFCIKNNWDKDLILFGNYNINLSEQGRNNYQIYNTCDLFFIDFKTRIDSLKFLLMDKIDDYLNIKDKKEFIILKFKEFDIILMNILNIFYIEYDFSNIINFEITKYQSIIDFQINTKINYNNKIRTKDDINKIFIGLGARINSIKEIERNIIENNISFLDNIPEDSFYLFQLINCFNAINKLENDLIKKAYTNTEIAFIKNKKNLIPQFIFNQKSSKVKEISFNDLFYNSKDAEPSLEILKKLTVPIIDDDYNYIGNNKGTIPLWIEILSKNNPSIIKKFKNTEYSRTINKKIKGLNLTKEASEFGLPYKSLTDNNIEYEIKKILSNLSIIGNLRK